ncbi:MAG: division/cell wall cluster transcriptional repressor MraZ [candidate division Zixibacteria bacterium]|nr:division/cell wall cluster transcriptional repressor MraZ [candidate division Zixibacteria bacterium]
MVFDVIGFFGRYSTTVDEKGRCILPAKLRAVCDDAGEPLLAGDIILTKGLEGCLAVYPETEWNAIQARMATLDFTDKAFRSFSRRFYSFAAQVKADKNGRILIPAHLIEEADLGRELVVMGVNRWIEIWNPQLLKYYLERYAGSYEDVAAKLFTGDGGSSDF